jgi:5'-3' exonuclease
MKNLGSYRPYDVMYIDGMNLLTRSYHGMADLSYKGHRTGMLYGVSRLILDWRHKNNNMEFVFLWEGKDSWRKKKYPIYKAQRHDTKSAQESADYFDALDRVKKALPSMGVRQGWADTYEADDLAATLAPLDNRNALYSSGDWDWWELRAYGTILYQHSDILSKEDMDFRFIKKFNAPPVPPDKLWLFKVLTGDPSDNVSGIPRFPKKLASALCNNGATPGSLVQILHKMGKRDLAEKVKANAWLIERNIDLLHSSSVPLDGITWIEPEYSQEGFGEVLLKSGMSSLYDKLTRG